MLITKLRSVGGSVMFAIPKAIIDGLDLAPNASVGLSVEQGKLVVDPHPRPRFTLSQLLAECDVNALRTADDAAWLADHPVGTEIL